MAISPNREDRERNKFIESTGTPGQVAVVVTNPDGSNIGSGGGAVTDVNLTKVGGTNFALGQQLATASLSMVLTAIQVAALSTRGATSSVTSVNDTASSTTLLASNANRFKYSVFNNSTEILYLKEGTTASLASFTVAIPPLAQYGFYESTSYTGRVDGIWANDSTGTALITEITA